MREKKVLEGSAERALYKKPYLITGIQKKLNIAVPYCHSSDPNRELTGSRPFRLWLAQTIREAGSCSYLGRVE